jgi:2-dehydro-3-deoxyphosphogluconate aldolase / (4S)-4-hydroxy-2-oxoglutarate aldolase
MTEAMQAFSVGCHNVRPYPADFNFCTKLTKYLPLLRLFPADLSWEDAQKFLKLPSVAGVSILNPSTETLPLTESTN